MASSLARDRDDPRGQNRAPMCVPPFPPQKSLQTVVVVLWNFFPSNLDEEAVMAKMQRLSVKSADGISIGDALTDEGSPPEAFPLGYVTEKSGSDLVVELDKRTPFVAGRPLIAPNAVTDIVSVGAVT